MTYRERSQPMLGRGAAGAYTLTIAVIDPEPIFREGLHAVLNRNPGLRWVGHATNHHGSLQMCEQTRPDIVVIDSGFDPQCHLIRLLRDDHPWLTVVLLLREWQRTTRFLSTAISAGVHGAVPRAVDPRRIGKIVRRAHTDRCYIDSSLATLVTKSPHQLPACNGHDVSTSEPAQMPLTRREYQVLQLVADGMDNSAIAKTLYLSVETVRTHVKSILRKLYSRDRTHAVSTAYRTGILTATQEDALSVQSSSSIDQAELPQS